MALKKETKDKIKELGKELKKVKEEMVAKSKALFTEVSKELFDSNPTLASYGWRQYTPSWCDGDQCTFCAEIDYPSINNIDGSNLDYDEDLIDMDGDEITQEQYDEAKKLQKTVVDFLKGFSEETLEDLFGDGVAIQVNRDGTVDTEEYYDE